MPPDPLEAYALGACFTTPSSVYLTGNHAKLGPKELVITCIHPGVPLATNIKVSHIVRSDLLK